MIDYPKGFGVYVVTCETRGGITPLKIGMSGNMRKRMYGLTTHAPSPVTLAWWAPCGSRYVARMAEWYSLRWAKENLAHTRGEWFEAASGDVPFKIYAMECALLGFVGGAMRDAVTRAAMGARGLRNASIAEHNPLGRRQGYMAQCEGYFSAAPIDLARPFRMPKVVTR